MKKILFGAILAGAAFYYLHPEKGPARRQQLSGLWGSRKETVLDVARSTSSVVAGASHEVGDLVGNRIGAIRSDGDATNGHALTSAAAKRTTEN